MSAAVLMSPPAVVIHKAETTDLVQSSGDDSSASRRDLAWAIARGRTTPEGSSEANLRRELERGLAKAGAG